MVSPTCIWVLTNKAKTKCEVPAPTFCILHLFLSHITYIVHVDTIALIKIETRGSAEHVSLT